MVNLEKRGKREHPSTSLAQPQIGQNSTLLRVQRIRNRHIALVQHTTVIIYLPIQTS